MSLKYASFYALLAYFSYITFIKGAAITAFFNWQLQKGGMNIKIHAHCSGWIGTLKKTAGSITLEPAVYA